MFVVRIVPPYDNQFAGTTWDELSRYKNNVKVFVVGVHMCGENFALLMGTSPSFRDAETWKVSKNEGNKALITMMLLQLCKRRQAGGPS